MNFSRKLKLLNNIFNINNRKLAYAIHVDPSSVSRWLNGKRIPPSDSEMVNKIIDYFINIEAFEYQKKEFYQLLNISESEIKNSQILLSKILKEWLYSPENVTIKSNNEEKPNLDHSVDVTISQIIKGIKDTKNSTYNIKSTDQYNSSTGKIKETEVFIGIEGIRNAFLRIANDLLDFKHPGQLIFTSTDTFFWHEDSEFMGIWFDILKKLLEKNHCVKVIYNLHRGLPEISDLLSVLLPLIATGRFEAYYYPNYVDNVLGVTIAAVPGRSAIQSVISHDESLFGNTFLYKDNSIVDYFWTKLDRLITKSKKLLFVYNSQNMLTFLQDIYTIEESIGSRFVCRNGLTSLTIPLHLYKKLLKKSDLNKTQIQKRYELHRKRLETLKYKANTHYMDICFIEAINNMTDIKGFEYYLIDVFAKGVVFAEATDVLEHLRNTVDMLENIDNFEIALVDRHDFFEGNSMYWAVMEDKAAIFSTWDLTGSPTCILIKENTVVNEFEKYFRDKWNKIPSNNKNKKWVISKINSKIEKLEKLLSI